jgi:homospermidine synthase
VVDPHPVHEPETGSNISFVKVGLTRTNLREEMDKIFAKEAKIKFCVNMSVDV